MGDNLADTPDELESVAQFRDGTRASLCRVALEAADIQAWLSTEYLAGVAPHLAIAVGIDVLVQKADVAAARKLMAEFEAGAAGFPVEAAMCPLCGSTDSQHIGEPDRTGALLGYLFVGIPRPDVWWRWKCAQCGNEWQ